ncbi:host attachment protein [Massilia consociata]|uniref:Host attachment protein n=1 Tax=Massilia consociata TaxID=760117 RepID=A0ABV6FJG9_9BURK
MQATWIMTANAGRARIFSESDPAQPLQEVEDMVNPAAHLRTAETETDRLGPTAATNSSHNIGGQGTPGYSHTANAGAPNKTYQPAVTPEEHAAEKFAKDISKFLMQAHQEGRFKQLILSASPQFLGTLRANLDQHILSAITQEFNKDYTNSNAQQLREQLHAQQAKSE